MCYSLLEDRVPYGNGQQAVNIVGDRAPLNKQEQCDYHRHTCTQPHQGVIGDLQARRGGVAKKKTKENVI